MSLINEAFEKIVENLGNDVALTFARMKGDPENPDEVVMVLSFCEKGFGFGEIAIKQTPSGVFVDTEMTSLNRVKKYFEQLLDKAILDTNDDPEAHKRFNEVMGRRCAGSCTVCFEQE